MRPTKPRDEAFDTPPVCRKKPSIRLRNLSCCKNRIYKSKDEFYNGSVVLPEWNQAQRMVLLRVEKGEKIALGKIEAQNVELADGSQKFLQASEEFQFILPVDPDSEFMKSGGDPKNWLSYLSQTKVGEKARVTIIEEDLILPPNW